MRFADFFIVQSFKSFDTNLLDLEYIKTYDSQLHANLKFLKDCSPEEVNSLDLDFSILTDNLGVLQVCIINNENMINWDFGLMFYGLSENRLKEKW